MVHLVQHIVLVCPGVWRHTKTDHVVSLVGFGYAQDLMPGSVLYVGLQEADDGRDRVPSASQRELNQLEAKQLWELRR